MADLRFQYKPLTFIKSRAELKNQIRNTLIMRSIFDEFNTVNTLGNLLRKTQYGYTASAKLEGNCKLLRITDIKESGIDWSSVPHCDCPELDNYRIQENDILIARTGGTTGKSFIVGSINEEVVFASYLIRLTSKQENNPIFIYLFLNSYTFWDQIIQLKRGTAQPNVNAEKLKNVLLPICSKDTQDEIVHYIENGKIGRNFIEKIDTKIKAVFRNTDFQNDLLNNIEYQQSLLKQMRQSILQEAVEGKLTEEWRKANPELISGENHAARLLEKIKAEKERLVKEGKIKKQKPLPPITEDEKPFELPDGWVWCRLGEIVSHNSGKTLDRGRNKGQPRKYITTSNLYWGYFILDDLREMLIKDDELEKCTARKGDLLICEGGEAGRASVWEEDYEICFQNHIHRVRPFCEIDPYYIYRYFQKINFTGEINKYKKGMGISNLSGKALSSIKTPLPPLAEEQAIVEKVDRLMAKIDALEQQVSERKAQAEQLMQAVLREAFNGA